MRDKIHFLKAYWILPDVDLLWGSFLMLKLRKTRIFCLYITLETHIIDGELAIFMFELDFFVTIMN
jgi:hypothetical protein